MLSLRKKMIAVIRSSQKLCRNVKSLVILLIVLETFRILLDCQMDRRFPAEVSVLKPPENNQAPCKVLPSIDIPVDIKVPEQYKEFPLDLAFWISPNPHNFHYILTEPKLCGNHTVFLLTYIHSAPTNKERRNFIRTTWGSLQRIDNVNIRNIFLVGLSKNRTVQTTILRESLRHHDIIQEDFIDDYRNLTYKNVMGMKWVFTYCRQARYILKTDDDVIVNMGKLIELIKNTARPGDKDMLCGSVRIHTKPIRNATEPEYAKWVVSEREYPDVFYPPHCNGVANVMNANLAGYLYLQSLRTRFLFIDDVYMTGIVSAFLGVTHHQLDFKELTPHVTSDLLRTRNGSQTLFLLYDPETELSRNDARKLWDKLANLQ